MQKLTLPPVDFSTALTKAISGIGNPQLRQEYTNAFAQAPEVEAEYCQGATGGNLYSYPRVDAVSVADPIIHGTLRKSHLTKLYSQYFVPEKKPARHIYEAIKVTANGKCPLCGGVGHVRTLDHYLPKANFPLYSVLPANLVPCCRDCNSEKLNAFAAERAQQTLHPYFDHDRFFAQKWIHARVIPSSPPVLEYFVLPPAHWDDEDRSRAIAHFEEYGLGGKFSIEAAADIPETMQTRRTTMLDSSPQEFSMYLAEKGQTHSWPVNNWRRVMFTALASDVWFCSQDFA